MQTQLMKKQILGIGVTDATKSDVLEYVMNFLKSGGKNMTIVTPNPEILVYAARHKDFASVLNSAAISLPDGVGVVVAGAILGKKLKMRITGVDFMKNLCENSAKKPITVGFLGGKPGVALKASECLKREFPGLSVGVVEAGNPDVATVKMIQERLEKSQPRLNRGQPIDILFVGFGFPKQEKWIHEYIDTLPVRVAMAVGGSFDILSSSVPRAPRLMREIGLEWLWRLILQPWRIKRQLSLLEFMWLVAKERFSLA